MTDRHNLIFYLMLAGILAGMVSLLIDKHSLYDHLKVRYLREIQMDEQPTRHLEEVKNEKNEFI